MRLSSPGMLVDINRIAALQGIDDRGEYDPARRAGAALSRCGSPLIAARGAASGLGDDPMWRIWRCAIAGPPAASLALADPSAEDAGRRGVAERHDSFCEKAQARAAPSLRAIFSRGFIRPLASDDEMITERDLPAAQAAARCFGISMS